MLVPGALVACPVVHLRHPWQVDASAFEEVATQSSAMRQHWIDQPRSPTTQSRFSKLTKPRFPDLAVASRNATMPGRRRIRNATLAS